MNVFVYLCASSMYMYALSFIPAIAEPQFAQPYPASYPSQAPPSYDALYLAKAPDPQAVQVSCTNSTTV